MVESFSRCQNEIPTLPAFEDGLEGNTADYIRKDSGGRVGEVRSSIHET